MKRMLLTGLGTLTLLGIGIALAFMPLPFFCAFGITTGACFAAALIVRGSGFPALFFNIGVAFLALAALEAWFEWQAIANDRHRARYRGVDLYDVVEDPRLGYALRPSSERHAIRHFDDEVVYDATYTTNSNGWRISHQRGEKDGATRAVVFFGGSFTFGDGLNDDETLPWATGAVLGDTYETYNFGAHGYGPQQMLSILESGRMEELLRQQPSHVIYSAISEHVGRASGHSSNLKSGPRYALQADGSVALSGTFADEETPQWISLLEKYQTFQQIRRQRWVVVSSELERYIGIVERSRDEVSKRFPEAEFHMIFWDLPNQRLSNSIVAAIEERDISLHRVTEILPGHPGAPWIELSPHDGHPSAESNRQLASYIARKIVAANHL